MAYLRICFRRKFVRKQVDWTGRAVSRTIEMGVVCPKVSVASKNSRARLYQKPSSKNPGSATVWCTKMQCPGCRGWIESATRDGWMMRYMNQCKDQTHVQFTDQVVYHTGCQWCLIEDGMRFEEWWKLLCKPELNIQIMSLQSILCMPTRTHSILVLRNF